MFRKITDIYEDYKIMPNLQKHMLRVAAVASVICDNFSEKIDKDNVVIACLFHDMGNIIKSDLNYFPNFLQPEGLEYWQKVKEKYIEKYGSSEHTATETIMKEIGLPERAIFYFKNMGFHNSTKNETEKFLEHKICNYSDMRVGPYGVIPMEERIEEGHKRYLGREHSLASDDFEFLVKSLRNIEKQIFAKCKIKPEDVNNESVAPIILELRNFVVQ